MKVKSREEMTQTMVLCAKIGDSDLERMLGIKFNEDEVFATEELTDRIMGDGMTEKTRQALGEKGLSELRSIFAVCSADDGDLPKLLVLKAVIRLLLLPMINEVLSSRRTLKTLMAMKEAADEKK